MRRRRSRGSALTLYLVAMLVTAAAVLMVTTVGQRLLQKEVVQSSVDAAALAGAVVRAKALNVIAFTNLAMAALLAIAIVVKGIALGLDLFLPVAKMLCNFCPAAYCDYCEYLPKAAEVQASYEAAGADLDGQLTTLAQAERTVAELAPALAVQQAYLAATHPAHQAHYGRGLTFEPLPRAPEPLPLSDGSWEELWGKAQRDLGKVTSFGLAKLWRRLRPGPARPVNHAHNMAAMNIPEQNERTLGEVNGDALPLRLADGWKERRFFRGKSSLGDDRAGYRRTIAALGTHDHGGAPRQGTLSTAQAEVFAFADEEDLWHMNWRARLSLSKPLVPVPDELRRFWVH
jgi:hypothetical protein